MLFDKHWGQNNFRPNILLFYEQNKTKINEIALHPKHFTIMLGGGGVSPQSPPVCSIHSTTALVCSPYTSYRWRGERDRANQVYALTTHQLQVERRERDRANQVYALTTHQLQVEKRERDRANQVYAITTHQLQVERRERDRANQVYALTTHPATGVRGREREIEPIKCMLSPHTSYRWRGERGD